MALAISFGFSLLWHFVYVEIQNGAPSRLTLPGKLARNCCRRQALYVLPTELPLPSSSSFADISITRPHPWYSKRQGFRYLFFCPPAFLLRLFSRFKQSFFGWLLGEISPHLPHPPDCFRWVQKKGNLTYAASSIEKSRQVFLLSLQVKSLSFLLWVRMSVDDLDFTWKIILSCL